MGIKARIRWRQKPAIAGPRMVGNPRPRTAGACLKPASALRRRSSPTCNDGSEGAARLRPYGSRGSVCLVCFVVAMPTVHGWKPARRPEWRRQWPAKPIGFSWFFAPLRGQTPPSDHAGTSGQTPAAETPNPDCADCLCALCELCVEDRSGADLNTESLARLRRNRR